ncbi:MAG: S8 family serine peptidase [Emcibacter sp.]|nr:S8 family serine peptidase [Emcibacter sp.]
MDRTSIKSAFLLISCFSLASCGSSGGSSSGGAAVVAPAPPPPPPVIEYNTVEFRNNYGLAQMNAIVAYDNGATGQGVTVAVIDTGVDQDNVQLSANIHADSTNIVTGNVSDLDDVDGHGTAVAAVVAGVRDPANNSNNNTHGVAFNAEVLVLNAANPGSCSGTDGCEFFDSDIAAALDYARVRGVKVVNISLGGDGFNTLTLINAYKRAVNAGMVIILAAGNRDDTDTDFTVAQPENSASVAWASWANGQIIVVGAVGQASTITDFSHRAGNVGKDVFLVAAGDRILSPGIGGDFFLWSGTSFATPHIAGAAALLMEAFPNLTGKQVADLLFDTATDLGALGADVIYGRGLVNLAEAFQPQGSTSIAVKTAAGTTAIVDMDSSVILGGEAFGGLSGLSSVLNNSLLLDGYDRSFQVDLGQKIFTLGHVVGFDALVGSRRGSRSSNLQFSASTRVKFSWIEDDRFQQVNEQHFSHQNNVKNRVHDLRMKLGLSLGAGQDMTIAQGLSLKEALEDYEQDEFLTIGKEDFTALMGRKNSQAIVFGQQLNRTTRLDLVMGHGEKTWQQYRLTADNYVMMARLDHDLSSSVTLGFDLGVMTEKGSVLGSLSTGAISLGKGATTTFVGGRVLMDMAKGLNFFARASYGRTKVTAADLSLVEQISSLTSGSLAFGVMGKSLFQSGDRLSFAISQPLRVMGGYADVSLVTGRDFSKNLQDDSLSFVSNQVSLSPKGREIDFELAYHVADILGAQVDLNFLHQINPGHNQINPDNTGFLIRFGSEF